MTRQLLPVLLSMTLLGLLPAAAGAGAQDRAVGGTRSERNQTGAGQAAGQAQVTRGNDSRIAVTRSDGSTGYTRPPDPKDIRKLVNYMRDGINRADRAEKQRQTRRVQNRRR